MDTERQALYMEERILEIENTTAEEIAEDLAGRYNLGEHNCIINPRINTCHISMESCYLSSPQIEVKKLQDSRYSVRVNLNAINSYHLSNLEEALSKLNVKTK